MRIGQKALICRRLKQEDFNRFALLSGDNNPIHTDPSFAAQTRFGKPVAHGAFLFGLISSVLGTQLPGPGTVILYQELMFPTPTYAGEEITVQVEVIGIDAEKGRTELSTLVLRPNGEIGCQGLALVQFGSSEEWPRVNVELPPPPPSEGWTLKGFRLGESASLRRAFTYEEVQEYIKLTGDANPIYMDLKLASRVGLSQPPVPAPLLEALFSCLLGAHLPGWGTNYLKQRLLFLEPVYLGEEVTAKVEIIRLRPEKELINLRTTCFKNDGRLACDGEALVLVRDIRARKA